MGGYIPTYPVPSRKDNFRKTRSTADHSHERTNKHYEHYAIVLSDTTDEKYLLDRTMGSIYFFFAEAHISHTNN